MTFTIQFGWWLLPTVLTIVAFLRALELDRGNVAGRGDYGFSAFASAVYYGVAMIVSLMAWLVWALVA